MGKNLVIVESPSKSKTIEKYLGSDYVVTSSKGHIRDLATTGKGGLGIDIEDNFKPNYVINKDKKDVVKDLKKCVKEADYVYLATDPDREGEAISWHLADELGLDTNLTNRVVFNEVTHDAVVAALNNPRQIDQNLVKSQETRRVLDRIIGFKLSKLLQKKIKSKSAGRVQSVALRLICEREKEIEDFIPEEYWRVKASFEKDDIAFEAELAKYQNKKIELKNAEDTQRVFESLDKQFIVSDVKKTQKKRSSKPPFITSTLQQEASSKLNFKAKRTMMIAQKLYEGIDIGEETVGLITYMRTDSIRLSDAFIGEAKPYIEEKYGKDYVGSVKVSKKTPTEYGLYGFKTGSGDCYVMAATFYWMAKVAGYDAHYVKGYFQKSGGKKGAHAWVEIDQKVNGKKKTYVYDPNFQKEYKLNGYKLTYGAKRTLKYVNYKRVN